MRTKIEQVEFILNTFRMFGDPDAPFWFLGLEESTDDFTSADEHIQHQYKSACESRAQSKTPLFSASSVSEFIGNDPNSNKTTEQKTWAGYIKLLLSIHNAENDKESPWNLDDVYNYQRKRLGRIGKDLYGSCLMELSPLPRKTRSHGWPYKDLAVTPELSILKSYSSFKKHRLMQQRPDLLLKQVEKHTPKVLFCFGSDCKNMISKKLNGTVEDIAVTSNENGKTLPVSLGMVGPTLVVFSYHPTAQGVSTLYWRELGALVAQKLFMTSDSSKAA